MTEDLNQYLEDKDDFMLEVLKKKQDYPGVIVDTINPKSVSIAELYGEVDKISHDWTDGILALKVKHAAEDKTKNKRWIVLDGPVDANWIENLNTVLDDNKKLCLSSGEVIKMTPEMTMMFEVDDLSEASPATVSRCGMVYTEPDRLGSIVLFEPWVNCLPDSVKSAGRDSVYRDFIPWIHSRVETYLFDTIEDSRFILPSFNRNWLF